MATSVLAGRMHRDLQVRARQIELNTAASLGGRKYVDLRLNRAPNESDLSWNGSFENGKLVLGRRERTFFQNDAVRVCAKIEQYIFSQSIDREGADAAFLDNVTGDGTGVDAFMQHACREITTSGWCWVQVDRQAWDATQGRSLLERELAQDGVRWRLWPALSVPDWCIDEHGVLRWLITESLHWADDNPFTPARTVKIRTLFRIADDGTVRLTEECASDVAPWQLRSDAVLPGLHEIPFVLIGKPSPLPWWFDDVEAAQAKCLNLASLHNETLLESVYPQMVVAETTVSRLDVKLRQEGTDGAQTPTIIRELVRGRKHPIIESGDDKGVTRYIMPDANALSPLVEEQERTRKIMFENAGLSLFNRETRQVQTAESKAFDQLDVNATLRHRAAMLQKAEQRMVALSAVFDPAFAQYTPAYPVKFDVLDAASASAAVQTVCNLPNAPLEVKKLGLEAGVRLLQSAANFRQGKIEEALQAIDDMQADEPPTFGFGNFTDAVGTDEMQN